MGFFRLQKLRSRRRDLQDNGARNVQLKTGSPLPYSDSTPGDFLLLNNALNEM